MKTRMDRLGHVNEGTSVGLGDSSDQAQLLASEIILKSLEVAGSQLKQHKPAAA